MTDMVNLSDLPPAPPVDESIYSAIAIITRGEGSLTQSQGNARVLLVTRKHDSTALGFPGGKLEGTGAMKERPENACIREVLEETGIQIERMYEVHRGPAANREHICVAYWVRTWHGEPMAMEDDVMVGWMRWLSLFAHGFDYSEFHRAAYRGYKRICKCLQEEEVEKAKGAGENGDRK